MELYYKAKNGAGELVEGYREAKDKFELAHVLRAEGLTVLFAGDTKRGTKNKIEWLSLDLFGGVRMREKIIFANNLSAMVAAGLTLSRALEVIEKQTANKNFKKIIHTIYEKINAGESLSAALSAQPKVFPEVFSAMVATAEESGKLPEALKIVAEQMEKSYNLMSKIRGAMIYPSVIIVAMIAIGILMMIYLIPTLTATFKDLNVELPLSTKVVIWVSDFMVAHILLVIFAILAIISSLIIAFRSRRGKDFLDFIILRLPVVGNLACETNSAVVMRTVSSLVSAGVSLVRTMEITERVVSNHYYKRVMTEAREKVQKGIPLSNVFAAHANLFPVFVEEMSAVGEETGKLPEMLLKGALFYEGEVDQATKNLSTIIEPVLMIVIGVAVGFFAVSMIGPMYSMTSAIK